MDELQLEVAEYTDIDHWLWRLTDAGGAFLADHTVALDRTDPRYQAFVDLYPYLRYYAVPDRSWSTRRSFWRRSANGSELGSGDQ